MKLTWYGHSAFRIDTADAVVMLDPFLDNPTFKGDRKAAYAGATHVILTHGHDDHLGSTLEICQATGATLIANWEICNYFASRGVADISPGNHGGEIDLGPFRVAFVAAHHSSASIAHGMPPIYLGNPCGIVVKAEGEKTLLHMGDTDLFSDMALIAELHQPKVGIVPIGDRFTMGARLAAIACNRFYEFETAIPCHYGTFDLLDQTADRFVTEMKGSKTRVLVPERGAAVAL